MSNKLKKRKQISEDIENIYNDYITWKYTNRELAIKYGYEEGEVYRKLMEYRKSLTNEYRDAKVGDKIRYSYEENENVTGKVIKLYKNSVLCTIESDIEDKILKLGHTVINHRKYQIIMD